MPRGLTLARMILREMQRAKGNALLCLVTVLFATGLLVTMVSITRASVDATRVMMRDMGFNLLITPEGVEPARYQALDFEGGVMPEEYVEKLAGSTVLAQHFVGKYQKTIQLDGVTVVLTGVLPEVPKFGTSKTPMPTAYTVEADNVMVRRAAADALGVGAGDTLSILGEEFTVSQVLENRGHIPEDIRVFAQLQDVQRLLDKPGVINAIDALACWCPVETEDIIGSLLGSIERVLPDVNVEPYQSILVARQKQREMVYRLELIAVVVVVIGAATAIWGLTYQNVSNRRQEIGVLRALGVPNSRITMLFIGKTIAYGLLGAFIGCAIGYFVALNINMTGRPIPFMPGLYARLVIGATAAAILFSMPPIVMGLTQEPTSVLRDAVT